MSAREAWISKKDAPDMSDDRRAFDDGYHPDNIARQNEGRYFEPSSAEDMAWDVSEFDKSVRKMAVALIVIGAAVFVVALIVFVVWALGLGVAL